MAMTKAEESKILASNMDIVTSLAKRYAGHVSMDDLIQEGSIGFLRGMRKWRPEGGASLRTYAGLWAHSCIRHAIRKNKMPDPVSLDAPLSEGEGTSLLDVLPSDTFESPFDATERNERIQNVLDAIASLEAREREIIRGSAHDTPNAEIGRRIGISRERVRQIKVDVVEAVKRRVARAS